MHVSQRAWRTSRAGEEGGRRGEGCTGGSSGLSDCVFYILHKQINRQLSLSLPPPLPPPAFSVCPISVCLPLSVYLPLSDCRSLSVAFRLGSVPLHQFPSANLEVFSLHLPSPSPPFPSLSPVRRAESVKGAEPTRDVRHRSSVCLSVSL